MKKIIMLLLVGILMISFTSAANWDNVKHEKDKTFDGKDVFGNKLLEKYKPIEIKNALGLGEVLFEGYLSQHDDTCGIDCESTLEVSVGKNEILIDKLAFNILQRNGSWLEQPIKNYSIMIKEKNKNWVEYNVGDEVKKGIYTVKITGKKSYADTVDWIITSQGQVLSEWAIWGGEYVYDEIDDSSINTSLWTETNTISGTCTADCTETSDYLQCTTHCDGAGAGQSWSASSKIETNNMIDLENIENISLQSYLAGWGDYALEKGDAGQLKIFGTTVKSVITGSDNSVWSIIRNETAGANKFAIYDDGVYKQTITATDNNISATSLSRSFNGNGASTNGYARIYYLYYKVFDFMTLNSPADEFIELKNTNVTFNITSYTTSPDSLQNISLYINGIFNETKDITGTENTTNFTKSFPTLGDYNWSVYICDDNLCRWSDNRTLTISTIKENSQTYTNPVYETSVDPMAINISYTASDWTGISGSLIYNGTTYAATPSSSGNNVVFSKNLTIPVVSAAVNETFYWAIKLTNSTGSYNFNTTFTNQTIQKVGFELCNVSASPQLIFKTFDTLAPTTAVNATFASAWSILNSNGGTVELSRSFEDDTETNSTWAFCISPSSTNYTVSVDVTVDATDYTPTYHFIVDTDYSNSTSNISLYLLADNDSTLTEFKVVDSNNKPIEGAYITIQRYDVGTDTYYNVAEAKTDNSGTDLAYLKWYDQWYRFLVIVNGQVVASDGPKKISASPVNIQVGSSYVNEFTKFDNIDYSLTFNNVTNNFILTFVDAAGTVSSSCLKVIKRNVTNDYLICDDCETSNSATLYCSIAGLGNGTYIANFYATGSPQYIIDVLIQYIGVTQKVYDLLGESNATSMAILIAGIVLSFFLISPALGVIGAILGMVIAAAVGFQPIEMVSFMGIVVVGIIIIWAVKK